MSRSAYILGEALSLSHCSLISPKHIRILIPVYAIALFLPTIINELGFTAAHAQLLAVPPFVAGCITTIAIGYLSDKYNIRGPFVIGCCLFSLIGYLMLYLTDNAKTGYGGSIIAACGEMT